MQAYIHQVMRGEHLSALEAEKVFSAVVGGEMNDIEISALTTALKVKGERVEEIAGAARALRRSALPFDPPDYPFADTCGTGGDGANTVNISTATAFVAAACGLPVAKHLNRSVSSACGSADVLEAAGARIEVPPHVARACLDTVGVCMLYAPQYHAGIRHAMPVRRALGTRTIFNLLGPLANPAGPAWQLTGVYHPDLCRPIAETLRMLGCRGALVVHGDGLDEMAIHGPTQVALLRNGVIEESVIEPESLSIVRAPLSALKGGGPEENAAWLLEILAGRGPRPHIDAIALNTGALLWLSERADNIEDGIFQARTALRRGAALEVFRLYRDFSHGA